MTRTEELLRSTLEDHSQGLTPWPWTADAALGRAARSRRRRVVVASTVAVTLLAVPAVTVGGVKLPVPGRGDQLAAGVQRIALPGGGYPELTMDAANIYVWHGSDGPEGSFVAVLDRNTNRVLRQRQLPGHPERFVNGPGDSLWFSMSASSAGVGDVLVQLDGKTLAVRRTVRLTELSLGDLTPVLSLAAAGNVLWVGGELSLYGVDGTTGRLLRRIDLGGGHATSVVADPSSTVVYASVVAGPGPDELLEVDARTGSVLARRGIGSNLGQPVPVGRGVWVTELGPPGVRSIVHHLARRGLVELDAGTGGKYGPFAYVVSGAQRYLLVSTSTDPRHSRIECVEEDSGRVLGAVRLATPVLADAQAVYGLTFGALERVDTSAICGR